MGTRKKVIYTALTGGYDHLIQHDYVNPEYDYICFSNDFKEEKIGIWTICHIPNVTNNAQRLSRYPKLQPYKLLSEYDISLYVDANINIKEASIFTQIELLLSKDILLAGVKHQLRDCIYEESLRVMLTGQEKNRKAVLKQMSLYKKEGFPSHYGMYEANIILRQHNNPLIQQQCNDWWYFQSNYSKRDQLSYSYTLWKNKIPFNYLLPEDKWARNCDELECVSHIQPPKGIIKRTKNIYFKLIVPILIKILFPIYKNIIL